MLHMLETQLTTENKQLQTLFISAKNKEGIDELKQTLLSLSTPVLYAIMKPSLPIHAIMILF